MNFGTADLRLPRVALGAALIAVQLPAQVASEDVAHLVRELRIDPSSEATRQALLRLVVPQLATAVVEGDLDQDTSIEVFELFGELGPLVVEALPDLYASFSELPPEVWPAALIAFSRIAPHERPRLNTRFLLEPILDFTESSPGDHNSLFEAWIRLDERLLGYRPYGRTELLADWLTHGWGLRLGPVIDELGRRGKDAAAALPALEDYLQRGLLQSPDVVFQVGEVSIRFPHRHEGMLSAAKAMVKIDPDHPDSLSGHAVLLRVDDLLVRERSLGALRRAGPKAAAAVPFLRANLLDASPEGIVDSCVALGEIGVPARTAIIALEQLSDHENRQIVAGAEWALERLRDR